MPAYELEGVIPVVDPAAHVHPTAVLIGDVIVGPGCYIGPLASLRGDFGRLVVEPGANLASLRPAIPLTAVEPDRPRLATGAGTAVPLHEYRAAR